MKATWSAGFLTLTLIGCGGSDVGADGSGGAVTGGAPGSGGVEGDGGSTTGGASTGGASTGGLGGEGQVGTGGNGTGGGETGDRSACKRGVAYGYHSRADLAALSPAVSWWYNWAFVPDATLSGSSYRDQDVEYVPMIWGANSDVSAAATGIPDDAETLLGFNEPNFGSQANMSAVQAAALWPDLEEIADARGLSLVSPAVNFCGGDCQETDPFAYLDDFLAACAGCRVDALAIHIYVSCHPEGDNHAQWLINHVQTYESRFSHPLWLTEFACDDAEDEGQQIAFMEDAVEFLESDPRIARYAWFAGRADNVPHVDLLGADGELTALGQRYVDLAQPTACER